MITNIAIITGLVVATLYCLSYLISLGAAYAPNPNKEWWTRENTAKSDASMGAWIGVPVLLWPCVFFGVYMAVWGVLTLLVRGVHAL